MTATQTAPEWTAEELTEPAELQARDEALPEDAPRGLLSVRLSILTEDTTSPVRQELDLRRHAIREGIRVVGVARDLGVSATKKAPWERKELGDWLNNRIPEFDLILFWKLDRFIRRDSLALKPLIRGIPAVRSRRGLRRRRPVKLRADKAYFSAEHLAWLRERGLVARIARAGIESGERLGRHRWKIERSIAWLFGYRRLTV